MQSSLIPDPAPPIPIIDADAQTLVHSLRITPHQTALFSSLFAARSAADGRDLTPERYEAHLLGNAPLSVLPVLQDGTTWFTVLAFHGKSGRSWKSDIVGVAQAASRLAIPLYIERSALTSGGAHAWIFFARPIPVAQARRLAALLLLEACGGDKDAVKSFVQVFPPDPESVQGAADVPSTESAMLLPLDGTARVHEQSIFVQGQRGLPAIADQWALLSSVMRLDDDDVEHILLRDAARQRKRSSVASMRAALSASLVVPRPLPPGVARRVRQRLALPNPEYLRRKRAGQSLRRVPRLLLGWQRRDASWLLPRGLEAEFREWCADANISFELADLRWHFSPTPRTVPLGLPPEQRSLLDRLLATEAAILTDADETTRTAVALALVAERRQPTLLLTTNRLRVQHWREQALLAGFEDHEVWALSDGGRSAWPPPRERGLLAVGTLAEIHGHAERVDGFFGHLVLDDCSRAPLDALLEAVRSVPAICILGLHDGVPRTDGLGELVELFVGQPLEVSRQTVDNVLDVVIRPTAFRYDPAVTDASAPDDDDALDDTPPDELFSMPRPARKASAAAPASQRSREWNMLLDALSHDRARNELVAADVVSEAEQGNRCLVLTERREHATQLADVIGRETAVATALGSMPVGRKREALRQFRDGEVSVLVVTEQLMGPGFDPSHVTRLFLALPQSLENIRQRLSVLGAADADGVLRVYDYVDELVPRLRTMAQTRRRYYRKTKTTLNPDAMQLQLPFDEE